MSPEEIQRRRSEFIAAVQEEINLLKARDHDVFAAGFRAGYRSLQVRPDDWEEAMELAWAAYVIDRDDLSPTR